MDAVAGDDRVGDDRPRCGAGGGKVDDGRGVEWEGRPWLAALWVSWVATILGEAPSLIGFRSVRPGPIHPKV